MELTPRQNKTAYRLHRRNGGAVWWRVGTGKTRITFKWFALVAKDCKVLPRFIVVCRREAFADWEDEMKRCELPWRTWTVECEDDLYDIKTTKPVVYLISHGMLDKLSHAIAESGSMIQAICYDEGFLYKNSQTKHCKAANRISKGVGRAAILSGSVMTARNLEDVFGQLYAINRHAVLARTLTDFRSQYMFKFQIAPNRESQAAKWVAARGAVELVSTRIVPVSSIYFPTNNQRRAVSIVRSIEPTRDQLAAFDSLRNFFEIELKGRVVEFKNTPSIIIKCQQVSDGFVHLENTTTRISSAKMDYLLSAVSELLLCGEKVVIWCAFQHSVNLILQSLQKKMPSVKAYGMHGGKPFDIAGWYRNGQVAVATVGSGSSVNHFRHCAYALYFSHSFKWLDMQQSMGRTDRHDSKHQTCFYYYLQTKQSLDSLVYQRVFSSKKKEEEFITKSVNAWLKKLPLESTMTSKVMSLPLRNGAQPMLRRSTQSLTRSFQPSRLR
jgi:hypothetical protein